MSDAQSPPITILPLIFCQTFRHCPEIQHKLEWHFHDLLLYDLENQIYGRSSIMDEKIREEIAQFRYSLIGPIVSRTNRKV